MCLCTYAAHMIWRFASQRWLREMLLGLAFGGGATVSMLEPFILLPSGPIDARYAFVGIAAAFGGPISAVASGVVTVTARILMGGGGAWLGCAMTVLVAAGAMIWGHCTRHRRKKSMFDWMMLTSIISVPIIVGLIVAQTGISIIGMRLITNIAGTFIFGKMIETDIRRRQRERDLNIAAGQDDLTGLPNRRALMDFVAELEASPSSSLALLVIDIDHFKNINDHFGHATGDDVLRGIGAILMTSTRGKDFAARFGGEEFAVIFPTKSHMDAVVVADRLRLDLCRHLEIKGEPLTVTVSIGGAFFPSGQFHYADLFKKADAALYEAKRTGRNRVVFAPDNTGKLDRGPDLPQRRKRDRTARQIISR